MTKLLQRIKNYSKVFRNLFFLLVLVSAFMSCYKSPQQLGMEILPKDSKLKVFYSDTATIHTFSVPIDSVRSDKLNYNIAGSLNDPVFGRTTAGFYTQFQLSTNGHSFGENPKLDSLVLQLRYYGFYGDTTTTLKLHTYEMKEGIDYDSIYYSNKIVPVYSTDYSNLEFVGKPHNSIILYHDTIKNAIRINLSNIYPDLGEKLLNADSNIFKDNTTFQDYFKGLYIVTEPVAQGGVLLYFNLISHFSHLTIYYSNTEQDSLNYSFFITTTAARVNRFEHDFNFGNSAFQQQVVNGDSLLGDEKFYIQGISGVKSLITFPHIKDFAKLGKIGINEAKLELSGFAGDKFYNPPKKLALLKRIGNGAYDFLPDQFGGEAYFGGIYDASRNVYTFRITQYIQSFILDTTQQNNGLYLFIGGSPVNPERFIFNGQHPESDTLSPIKLKIVYTDVD